MIFYDPVFYVLSGLLLYLITAGGLIPWVASEKGRSSFGWMLMGVFFTPLFALLALAAVPAKPPRQRRAEEISDLPPGEFKWRKPGEND
jgi:hypothetical protein